MFHKIFCICFLVVNSLSYNFHKIKCTDFKCTDQCILTNKSLDLSSTSIKIQKVSIIPSKSLIQSLKSISLLLNPRQPLACYFSLNLSSARSELNTTWKHAMHILLCVRLLLLSQITFLIYAFRKAVLCFF